MLTFININCLPGLKPLKSDEKYKNDSLKESISEKKSAVGQIVSVAVGFAIGYFLVSLLF